MAKGVPTGQVNDLARVSFYRAFGLLPDFQEALEAEYRSEYSLLGLTPMTYPSVKAIDNDLNPLATWLSHATPNPQ